MLISQRIHNKLTNAFHPQKLEIVNESFLHADHFRPIKESVNFEQETHFRILILSDYFFGMQLIDCHRAIHALLVEEFQDGMHALSIKVLPREDGLSE